ncbi:hypothetical protein FNF27_06146 [Cafeteria roenbergensis]|uniref:Thioredoxin domain-containing protein n=1 Tax=Cafeteria roenbergensis TaxID=33653 RepID=A0A5A8D9Z0_CAFRO|nr:hypothetical protein FNF28_06544 [Cafeteria roenbergensis]KAA0161384.1 hypothetical protein FNF31_03843 [Cafeteria roenbergensis]KAA0172111.1 hypothetical protein FNF27_06146 [Cafeteria roenbergensis]
MRESKVAMAAASGPADVGAILGERLLTTLEAAEDRVDEEIHHLESMEEDELEKLRRERMEQMRRIAKQKAEWHAAGHGEYAELTDEKDFFKLMKKSKRAVIHFYRPSTWRCDVVDKHLGKLAPKHMETRFLKVNAEKSPFLVERLRVMMLPTMVLIKDGRTDHAIIGFDEMGGTDDFPTEALEAVLLRHGMVFESACG